jgi:hypothetical protein
MSYQLSSHARTVLTERGITTAWLERTLDQPDMVEPDGSDPTLLHHLCRIDEHGGRVLRVIFNPNVSPRRVVTLYFDRKMKGKL